MILDERGRLCGYMTQADGQQLVSGDLVVRGSEANCRVALGALVREAKRREQKEIVLPLPWDDEFAVFLRQHVEAEFGMRTAPNAGQLMKVVDFPSLMRRLEPLLALRWRSARSALPPARFALLSEVGEVGLSVSEGRLRVGDPVPGPRVRIPQRWLSGLLTGYYSVREVALRKGAAVPVELLPVMDVLFPKGWPFVCRADRY